MQSSVPSPLATQEAPTVRYDIAGSNDTARMLRTLLGNLDGMVYRCRDDSLWSMEFVSEGCMGLTGYTAEDFLSGRVSYEGITFHEDRQRVRDAIYAGLAQNQRFDI